MFNNYELSYQLCIDDIKLLLLDDEKREFEMKNIQSKHKLNLMNEAQDAGLILDKNYKINIKRYG